MKKSILISSLITVTLFLTACGDSQADKEQKEREHASKIMKPVKMPM